MKEKYCGNCAQHDVYHYPDKIFCQLRYLEGENPIVDTLWCCPHWQHDSQPCYCLENAKQNTKTDENSKLHSAN